MKWILVKNGIVENVIVADIDFIDKIRNQYELCEQVEDNFYVGPGFRRENDEYIAPEPEMVSLEAVEPKKPSLWKRFTSAFRTRNLNLDS